MMKPKQTNKISSQILNLNAILAMVFIVMPVGRIFHQFIDPFPTKMESILKNSKNKSINSISIICKILVLSLIHVRIVNDHRINTNIITMDHHDIKVLKTRKRLYITVDH